MAIITISRGSFAGSKAVAERLSEHLGYPLLSREDVLRETVRECGIPEEDLNKTLNGAPPFWQQVAGKRLAYVKCVTAILLEHARRGNLVYHGITGHLLLSELPQVLRIRVIAEMRYRIKAAMVEANLKHQEAIAYIQRMDKNRSRWARLLYGVEWEDPGLYDMILNLGRISENSACETIERLAEKKEFESTAENQRGLENLSLSCKIWVALAKNPETRSADIQVHADDGDVVIGGTVSSAKALELIPQIVERVEGVRSLRSEFGVGTGWYW